MRQWAKFFLLGVPVGLLTFICGSLLDNSPLMFAGCAVFAIGCGIGLALAENA